ncbi:alcohol dehydrogenase catalytic domain-containing protein [Novosphingobium sp. G106]|uniref:zinc-dependent alcohol dehydrogenase n=1 Tax=Novosphingobium sp. G106 TaxID=2849500 RepID=UPI001C2D3746|nr:alcohol dehydrogenase catalytic domain-containing protein [Novosphingobium sp. G106]MBV1689581.1 alcohol dehydrogenase catalytic domain-containing protein [Novosphingobium sp. G106]
MRVAVFNGAGKPITIEDIADDPLPAGSVRIEVKRCGICGSDVSLTSGSPFDYAVGSRMGHESAGTVIELGHGVTSLKVGDNVAVMPRGFCGDCPPCRAGRPLFCEVGPQQSGGFGERMVITERSGFRFPASVSMAEGALVEPIACGRRAMRMARLEQGASVLVIGAGSIGIAAVYWARAMGAGRIVVATRTPARHAIALAMGADEAVSLGDDPTALDRAMPAPPDIVVEGIGKPGALGEAVSRLRTGGTIVSLGMCTSHDPVIPAFTAFRDATLIFPIGYAPEDFTETVRLFDAGSIRPGVAVTETVPLARLPSLVEEMRGPNDHLKVQITPD